MSAAQANALVGMQADKSAVAVTDQYLTFFLAGEEYGVDILRVQEIRGWTTATQIPNMPDFIKGVINLRGTIVPVIDLRRRFNMDAASYSATTVVIVLKVVSDKGDRVMGIVVDAVSDVYNVAADGIKPAPDFGHAISTDFLKGLATVNEKMVIVLDIDTLLNVTDLDAIANVSAHAEGKAA
jgi:purine-binding chemotaxis protein CheW